MSRKVSSTKSEVGRKHHAQGSLPEPTAAYDLGYREDESPLSGRSSDAGPARAVDPA
jgi:hypothetical protein